MGDDRTGDGDGRRDPASGDHLLECRHLVRRFGDRVAVDDVGFHIARGETYGLLGPNGAGKTTIISMVAGILAADAGEIRVAGRPMSTSAGAVKGLVGLVPQEIALYEDLTAAENLRFFGRLQGLGGRRLDERIDEVLEIVGLADRRGDRIDTYSGGMKRRANIAVGLLHQPELLILDEPTVGVDPQSRNQILAAVEALGGEGLAVLYTTHYMEEAERLCERIAVLDDGRVVAEGTRRQLVEQIGEHDRVVVRATGDLDGFAARLRHLDGVHDAVVGDGVVEVRVDDASAALARVVHAAEQDRVEVVDIQLREPDLEAVFLHLTGRALRD
jgi:ABC-2 type transport system ATP-binding protein